MQTNNQTQFIPGIHSVREAIFNNRSSIAEIWVDRGKSSPRIREIIELAERHNIPVLEKDNATLDMVLPGTNHQGIAALTEGFNYTELTELINSSSSLKGKRLLLAIDHITDEGNLGAILRTAAFFGVNGVIIPKDRSARISGAVMKRSSGGHAHVPVSMVVNLARAIEMVDESGFWIIGTSGNTNETIYNFAFTGDILLILGNEEKGISPVILKRCHQTLNIPSSGKINALNVSVAAGVVISEIMRQRQNTI
ncbi:MAG: 23S rRNA (guanosine(2251)-2'-O)-methyltransferase RlmB [Deltaproteobacteria bacterium]|nr:23S rRNA (guanosine(2251)-2'-O)-methyltransferase RlmB [Deltaproteobacteria bacterium]